MKASKRGGANATPLLAGLQEEGSTNPQNPQGSSRQVPNQHENGPVEEPQLWWFDNGFNGGRRSVDNKQFTARFIMRLLTPITVIMLMITRVLSHNSGRTSKPIVAFGVKLTSKGEGLKLWATYRLLMYLLIASNVIVYFYNGRPHQISVIVEIIAPAVLLVINMIVYTIWECHSHDETLVFFNKIDSDYGGHHAGLKHVQQSPYILGNLIREIFIHSSKAMTTAQRHLTRSCRISAETICSVDTYTCTSEYEAQAKAGHYTVENLGIQIMSPCLMLELGVGKAYSALSHIVGSLFIIGLTAIEALLPSAVRWATGVHLDKHAQPNAIMFVFAAFQLVLTNAWYLKSAVIAFMSHAKMLKALTLMISDNEQDVDLVGSDESLTGPADEAGLQSVGQEPPLDNVAEKQRLGLDLPRLVLTRPEHCVAFGRLRSMIDSVQGYRIKRFSAHISMLLIPWLLIVALLLFDTIVTRAAVTLTSLVWVVSIYNILLFFLLLLLVILHAVHVNAAQDKQLSILVTACRDISETLAMGKCDDEETKSLLASRRCMLDTISSLKERVGAVRLLGVVVDASIVLRLFTLGASALLTQALRNYNK